MEHLNQIAGIIALSMGTAWASGINLYAAILALGLLGTTGQMVLPPNLQIVTQPIVIMAAGVMFCIEFFADKIPGVDTGWDTIHSFIRIPGGALLAAAAVGDVNPAVMLAAGIMGGGLAAGTHAAKAGSRVLINTSPEPFSNWVASIGEDVAVIVGVWAALTHPWLFLAGLVVFVVLLIWLLPKLWRGIKAVFAKLASLFRRSGAQGTVVNAIEDRGATGRR
jgi:hypothetical protein